MTNHAETDIKIHLDNDLQYFYNYNRWRLSICKWVYHPKGHCERYNNKIKALITEVVQEQIRRNFETRL